MSDPPRATPLGRHLVAIALALALSALLYVLSFPSWSAFHASVDFDDGAFEDFSGPYYGSGMRIFEDARPAPGFYYSPFFAILMGVLVRLQGEASVWTWLVLQVVAFVLLALATLAILRPRRAWGSALCVGVLATSFPLAHNFHWGQVSTPLVAVGVTAILAAARACPRLAAGLVGVAASIKFYPVLWALPWLVDRRWRKLAYVLGTIGLLVFAVPALVIGPQATLEFLREVFESLLSARGEDSAWTRARKNQHFELVVGRLFADEALARLLARLFAWTLVALTLWRWSRTKQGMPNRMAVGFSIAFLSSPLLVGPAWPHGFVFLPFVQSLLALELERALVRSRILLGYVPIVISVLLSGLPLFLAVGDHYRYGAWALLAIANLLLFAPAWLWISLAPSSDRDQAQTE